ncbi:uncharacterized protein LOC126740743 [Anthonomus grandis grandis]|uniref:uncharacterized protein LOC126740743 n=1 Tax=Anthonomus grandis grandis TaxID=2921223 RepID=UPI00216611ED|nr:uncharacterized protein LOC126740743 [Anthonomus grandis grandis]
MTQYIINGFRKCSLFPLNPNNVDYTKCVRNTLENHNTDRTTQDLVEPSLSSDNIKGSKQVLEAIREKLVSYGINVDVIMEEIKILELSIPSTDITLPNDIVVTHQQTLQDPLPHITDVVPDNITGHYVNMDNIDIIPVQNIICMPIGDKDKEFDVKPRDIMPEKTSDEETDTEFNIESHQQVIPEILSSTSYHNEKDTDTKLNVEPWEITPETSCSHNETNTNTELNVEESGETLTETSSSTLYDENKTDTDLNVESREVTPETVPTSHAEKETVLQHQSSR